MMDNPEHYIEAFAAAGANEITIHVELGEKILQAIEHIKSLGCKAGLSVKPENRNFKAVIVYSHCFFVIGKYYHSDKK